MGLRSGVRVGLPGPRWFLGVLVMASPRVPRRKSARNWSKAKRISEAVHLVVDEGWTRQAAADEMGVARQTVSVHVKEHLEKAKAEAEREKARKAEAFGAQNPLGLSPLGINEKRRVPEDFATFDEVYFGHLKCPDCGVRHKVPDFHVEIADACESSDPRVLINLPPYHQLHQDTPILTMNRGWVTMGTVAPGDVVFDRLGEPTTVLGVSPLRPHPALRVTFSDGSSLLADPDHRWWVDPIGGMKPRWMTTGEILEKGLKTGRANRWRVRNAEPLDLPERDLPVDPYCFGAWLGDGSSANPSLFTSADPEIPARFEMAGMSVRRQKNSPHGWVISGGPGGRGSWRRTVLGLCPDGKRIPEEYLAASFKQRLALMQGLMDTDGTVKKRTGECKFSQVPGPLLDDFVALARTLGIVCHSRIETRPDGGLIGRVEFFTELPVFGLTRKAEALAAANSAKSRRSFTHRRIVSIVPEGEMVGRCITVDSPTETFLAGRELIPTGNSKSTNVTVKDTLRKICANPNHRTIIVSKSLSFTRTFIRALQELMSNTDLYEGAQRSLIEDWGPFRSEDGKGWSADQIYVAGRVTAEKDPTVQALGVGGQIYGRRADEIKFDDIATIENQRNPERVVEMLEWIDKEALSRIGKNGRAIWVGTRVSPGDIYYHLGQRPGYRVLRYPCIVDDTNELTLWPEHFPYSQAAVHRSEMTPSSFQLVYQQVDIPGLGASFTEEIVDGAKDKSRVTGHYESSWRLVAGLDPAGAGKEAGFTAFTLVGVDLATSKRYLIDQVAVKQMKAPQIRDQILDWSSRYPIYEWRVEGNGLQSQLVQYNEEIINALARRGVRVVGHTTNQNKWDPQFGVESMAPLMEMGMYSIPWASAPTAKQWQPFIEELIAFPMGRTADRVMSWWFAELGIRQYLQRSHLPLFDARHTKRWPNRIKRRRHVVDFNSREVRRVSPADQMVGHVSRVQLEQRRATVGRPLKHADAARVADERPRQGLVNVAGEVILEG